MFTNQVGSAKEKLHSSLCCRAGHWRTRFIQDHQYKHVQGFTVKWYVILFGHWTNKVSNAVLLREKYITDLLDQTIGVHFFGVMRIRTSDPKSIGSQWYIKMNWQILSQGCLIGSLNGQTACKDLQVTSHDYWLFRLSRTRLTNIKILWYNFHCNTVSTMKTSEAI